MSRKKRGILDSDIKGQGKNGAILKMDRVVALDKYKETKKETEKETKAGSGRGKAGLGIGKQTKGKRLPKPTSKKVGKTKPPAKKTVVKTSPKAKSPKPLKEGRRGMVVLIWTKEDYEGQYGLSGGQSNTYFSETPYFHSGTYEEVSKSNAAILRIIRYHLKIKGDKTKYTDDDLHDRVVINPSTRLYVADDLYYFEVSTAVGV